MQDTSSDAKNVGEIQRLKRDLANTRNEVKCREIELEQKEAKIAQLMKNCLGAPDEKVEEKELAIAELEERCQGLERELFRAKEDLK